jgi:hypothetical protein
VKNSGALDRSRTVLIIVASFLGTLILMLALFEGGGALLDRWHRAT